MMDKNFENFDAIDLDYPHWEDVTSMCKSIKPKPNVCINCLQIPKRTENTVYHS